MVKTVTNGGISGMSNSAIGGDWGSVGIMSNSSISGMTDSTVGGYWSVGNSVVCDGTIGSVSQSDGGSSNSDSWSVGNNGLGDMDSWGLSVNNGIESIDTISSVGDGTDGTIGLNKGVLTTNKVSISALLGGLVVSGKSVGHGVSVVVLWMRIVWLSSDGWGNMVGNGNWSSVCVHWSVVGDGVVSDGEWCGLSVNLGLCVSHSLGVSWSSISSMCISGRMMGYGKWGLCVPNCRCGVGSGGVSRRCVSCGVSSSISKWGTSVGDGHNREEYNLDHCACIFMY